MNWAMTGSTFIDVTGVGVIYKQSACRIAIDAGFSELKMQDQPPVPG